MTRETDLVSYLPSFLAEYPQLCATLEAENPEFRLLWEAAGRVLANEFIETADEYGISRFERLLGVYPERGVSLESRRERVLAWWFVPLPYTWRKLLEKLASVCGKDGFTARQYPEEYRIEVEILLENVPGVRDAIHSILPANMSYTLVFGYGSKIWNTEHIRFSSLRLHMGVMYWGADGLLDGSWLLDGSRLLDACRRYGVLVGTRFGSMELGQESCAELHSLSIQWKQSNHLEESKAGIKQRFSVAFFSVPRMLDGSWLLDGSVLLDAGLRYGLRPALKVALAAEMPAQGVDGTTETKTEDYWFLDGSVSLDGSRDLNSVYRKESLG